MRKINKLASVICGAAFGLLAMSSCEGGDIFSVNSPDWITEKVDSIANSAKSDTIKVSPVTLGATDNSDAFWGSHLDQDIQLEGNKSYTVSFTNYSSGANNWNNFYVVLRKADQTEYAVLRSDNYGWGDSYAGCTPGTTVPDWASWLAVMNGAKVTVTVTNYGDNTADVVANMVGTDGSTYTQKYSGIAVESTDLYLDFTTDGSHYVFDNDGLVEVASVVDQEPASMVLQNVPEQITVGTPLDSLIAGVTAKVTYADGAVKEVDASDLEFTVAPDLNTPGDGYLVAILSKTMLGKASASSIYSSAAFKIVNIINSIKVLSHRDTYYFYETGATTGVEDRKLLADPSTGTQVEATYTDGSTEILDNKYLTFSSVPTKEGKHKVTVTTENGKTAEFEVNVAKSELQNVTMTPSILGEEDCSTAWWSLFTNDVKIPAGKTYATTFTNYSSGASNWNNYVVILRNAALGEYAVVRADNYGWGNGYAAATVGCDNGGDWDSWLAAMNGAKVTLYVTNCNNGQADVQAVVTGNDGSTFTQYYLGINTIDPDDCYLSLTVDGSCLKFDSATRTRSARRR